MRLPSGFGTAANIPAACASATSATVDTADEQLGMAAKSETPSTGKGTGRWTRYPPPSPLDGMATTAVTTTSASSVANDPSGLMRWKTDHTATVAGATATAAGCHSPICANASMKLPMVLP